MNLDNVLLNKEGTKAGNLISASQPRWYLNCIWYWEASALHIVSFLPVSVETGVSCLLCFLFHLLCDVCVDEMTLLAKHDCSWVFPGFGEHLHLLLLFISLSWFLIVCVCMYVCMCMYVYICVCGVLMPDAFCFWLGRLPLVFSVVNNEFIFIYNWSAILEASGFLPRIMVAILLWVQRLHLSWMLVDFWRLRNLDSHVAEFNKCYGSLLSFDSTFLRCSSFDRVYQKSLFLLRICHLPMSLWYLCCLLVFVVPPAASRATWRIYALFSSVRCHKETNFSVTAFHSLVVFIFLFY